MDATTVEKLSMKANNATKWLAVYNERRDVSALAMELTQSSSWKYFPLKEDSVDYAKRSTHKPRLITMLADLPTRIIHAIITATFTRTWSRTGYANAIVTANRIHPTIRGTLCILDLKKSYVEGTDFNVLGKVSDGTNPKEWKRVAGFEKWRYISIANTMDVVLEFIQMTTLRCQLAQQQGDDPSKPIKYGFHEVHYAKCPADRNRRHSKHQFSNRIMNIFEACAQALCQNKYSMVGIVVHRMRAIYLASMAEVYLSMLFHAWVLDGTGFTHQWPGASLNSAVNAAPVCETTIPKAVQSSREYHFGILKKALNELRAEQEEEASESIADEEESKEELAEVQEYFVQIEKRLKQIEESEARVAQLLEWLEEEEEEDSKDEGEVGEMGGIGGEDEGEGVEIEE